MSVEDSVSLWMNQLAEGDEQAAQNLWERYFQRLVHLAGKRLPVQRRDFDEEDVALSAFHSLCQGVRKEKFPDLKDRENLWALLVVITARKAVQRVRRNTADKRGGGQVRGESIFAGTDSPEGHGINQVLSEEPTPEFALEVAEQSDGLLGLLPDESLKRIALLKLEGYSNGEIADQTGHSKRTVERRLGMIRRSWMSHVEPAGDD